MLLLAAGIGGSAGKAGGAAAEIGEGFFLLSEGRGWLSLVLSHGADPGKGEVSAGPAPAAAGGGSRPNPGALPPWQEGVLALWWGSEDVQETWVSPLPCCRHHIPVLSQTSVFLKKMGKGTMELNPKPGQCWWHPICITHTSLLSWGSFPNPVTSRALSTPSECRGTSPGFVLAFPAPEDGAMCRDGSGDRWPRMLIGHPGVGAAPERGRGT